MSEGIVIQLDTKKRRDIESIIDLFSDPEKYDIDLESKDTDLIKVLVPERIYDVLNSLGYFSFNRIDDKDKFYWASKEVRDRFKRSRDLDELFARLFVHEERLDHVSNNRKFDTIDYNYYEDISVAAFDIALGLNRRKLDGSLTFIDRAIRYNSISRNPHLSDRYNNPRVAINLTTIASMYLERQKGKLIEVINAGRRGEYPLEDLTQRDLFLDDFENDLRRSLAFINHAIQHADNSGSVDLKETIVKRGEFYFRSIAAQGMLREFSKVFGYESAKEYADFFSMPFENLNKLKLYLKLHYPAGVKEKK